MPSKEEACRQVQQVILDHKKAPIVYLACDLLGQEELLSHLVRTFGTKIFIDKEALPEYYADMMIVAPELVTEDPQSTRFHICEGFPKLYERAKIKFMQAHKRGLEDPLFIRPSAQWYTFEERLEGAGCGMILEVALKGPGRRHQPRAEPKVAVRDNFGVWHVCYSIHSCRLELERAMEILWPKEVISTTPSCHASEVLPKRATHPIIVSGATACWVSRGSHEEAGSKSDVTEKCDFKVKSAVLSSPTTPRARKKFCHGENPNKDYHADDFSFIVPLFGLARHTIPASPPLSFASTDSESDEEFVDLQSAVECSSGGCEGSPQKPQKTCESVNCSTLPDSENHGVSMEPIIAASLERIKESTEAHSNQNARSGTLASPADGEDFGTNELENKENITESVVLSDNNNTIVSSKGSSSHILGLAVFKESTRNVYRSFRAPIPPPLPSLLDLYNCPWMSEQI